MPFVADVLMDSGAGNPKPRRRAVLLGDTSGANHHGCWLVTNNLIEGLQRVGIEVVVRHHGKGWKKQAALAKSVADADLLVINGEGTIHHNRPLGGEYLDAGEYAAENGTPAFLVNTTWHANAPDWAKRARVFREIYVRESTSQEELQTVGTESVVVPDLSLATPSFTGMAGTQLRHGYLFGDSTHDDVSKRLLASSRRLGDAEFLPVISRDWSRARRSRRMKRQLQTFFGRYFSWTGMVPYRCQSLAAAEICAAEFLGRLSCARGLITGRFHAVTMAVLTGTPFLALRSNTPKIESLLLDVGLSEHRIIDPSDLVECSMDELVKKLPFNAEESEFCSKYVCQAQEGAAKMFQQIRLMVEAGR